MSTYHEETTDGGLLFDFYNTTEHADDRPGAAVVLNLVAQDESVQHIVATFSTEAFSGDTSNSGGKTSTAPLVSFH
jgi:hypothetical protein